jgi:hypothetical protein
MYQLHNVNGATCAIIQREEPVRAEVDARHPVGSSLAIRYLAYSPAIAHTADAERVAWKYVLGEAIVMVCAGVGAYIKQQCR